VSRTVALLSRTVALASRKRLVMQSPTVLNLANTITLLRILAVPLFLSALADGTYEMALIVFVAAGVSDGIDGAVARLTNTRTELGAHLDPLADKLLLISAFIALGILDAVPHSLMITVIVRDALILGGYLTTAVVTGQPMEMRPSFWGKATTFFQISTVALVLLGQAGWIAVPEMMLLVFFVATGVLNFISGGGYVLNGLQYYQDFEAGKLPHQKSDTES
jgi:cardiolipin synthase